MYSIKQRLQNLMQINEKKSKLPLFVFAFFIAALLTKYLDESKLLEMLCAILLHIFTMTLQK